jgi:DNA-binding CsgD family transcriptional regulator
VARCAAHQGHVAAAIRLFGSSAALFREIGIAPPPDRDPAADARALNGRISPAEYTHSWDAGWVLSPADAAAEALAMTADLMAENSAEASPEPASSPAARSAQPDHASAADDFGLTPRESEVLKLLADGLSDREIATALFLSPRTVGWHVNHILTKLDVPTRTAAATAAVRRGLI